MFFKESQRSLAGKQSLYVQSQKRGINCSVLSISMSSIHEAFKTKLKSEAKGGKSVNLVDLVDFKKEPKVGAHETIERGEGFIGWISNVDTLKAYDTEYNQTVDKLNEMYMHYKQEKLAEAILHVKLLDVTLENDPKVAKSAKVSASDIDKAIEALQMLKANM